MTQSFYKETVAGWKLARENQIRRLYKNGTPLDELYARFGKKTVDEAIKK